MKGGRPRVAPMQHVLVEYGGSFFWSHSWRYAVKHGNHDKHHPKAGNESQRDGSGIDRKLHNPVEDRLTPLEPLDLRQVRSIDDLVRAMASDEECFVVMTLAGAMTVAKQGLIIADLIDRGIVNAVVSTGALMAHGLVEATGRAHFRVNPEVSDEELYEQGYNRVYDTLEPEENLDHV